jgi:hypothetical protein
MQNMQNRLTSVLLLPVTEAHQDILGRREGVTLLYGCFSEEAAVFSQDMYARLLVRPSVRIVAGDPTEASKCRCMLTRRLI